MFIALNSGVAAANGAPTLATQGFALRGATVRIDKQLRDKVMLDPVIGIKSTAGSGVMTVTVRVWGYSTDQATWYAYKNLNAGAAIAETGNDTINYAEACDGLGHFDRVYVEVVALAGTTPSFDCFLFIRV